MFLEIDKCLEELNIGDRIEWNIQFVMKQNHSTNLMLLDLENI